MKNKVKTCDHCKCEISDPHFNRKRCEPCAVLIRKRPLGKLNKKQSEYLIKNAGIIPLKKIAKTIKTSYSTAKRFAFHNKIKTFVPRYSKQQIDTVIKFYEIHGKTKTEKKFKNFKIRSIVERYEHKKRCVRWTEKEIVQLLKLSCFVSFEKQALLFNRPRANAGSIVSVWAKRIKSSPVLTNGLPKSKARLFVTNKCPFIKLKTFRIKKIKNHINIYLWVDIVENLKTDCPEIISESFKVLAKFQRWIFGGDPRPEIKRTIEL